MHQLQLYVGHTARRRKFGAFGCDPSLLGGASETSRKCSHHLIKTATTRTEHSIKALNLQTSPVVFAKEQVQQQQLPREMHTHKQTHAARI